MHLKQLNILLRYSFKSYTVYTILFVIFYLSYFICIFVYFIDVILKLLILNRVSVKHDKIYVHTLHKEKKHL